MDMEVAAPELDAEGLVHQESRVAETVSGEFRPGGEVIDRNPMHPQMFQGIVGEAEIRGPLDMDHIAVDVLEPAARNLDGHGVIGIELHQAVAAAVADEAGAREGESADITAVQGQEAGSGTAVAAGRRRPGVQQFIARQDLAELVIAVRIVERIPVRDIVRTGEIDISVLDALHRILAAPIPLGQNDVQAFALAGGDILFLGLHLA